MENELTNTDQIQPEPEIVQNDQTPEIMLPQDHPTPDESQTQPKEEQPDLIDEPVSEHIPVAEQTLEEEEVDQAKLEEKALEHPIEEETKNSQEPEELKESEFTDTPLQDEVKYTEDLDTDEKELEPSEQVREELEPENGETSEDLQISDKPKLLDTIEPQINEADSEMKDLPNNIETSTKPVEMSESINPPETESLTIGEETHKSEKMKQEENVDGDVAAVVAAVEQAVAAKQTQPASTPTTTPRGGKKKAKPGSASKVSTVASTSSNLNNSITSTINDIATGAASSSPPSGHKRRKKDPYAPKAPLNGYLVYFNEERAEMRQKNPNIGFGELTKIIATKWKELPAEEKQKFINEADLDKERYVKEMADYKKSDAYKVYVKETCQAKIARNEESSMNESINRSFQQNQSQNLNNHASMQQEQPNLSWLQSESNIAGFDIPIFTEEFIEHSKSREHELRQLRKEINEIEQQNSVLNKHVDNLKQSTQKIETDIDLYKNSNNQLQKNVDIFRQTVLHCFNNTPLPNSQDYVPTPANIDDYIIRLFQLVQSHNQSEQMAQQQQNVNDSAYLMSRNFAIHVKSVFSKINFNSLFEAI